MFFFVVSIDDSYDSDFYSFAIKICVRDVISAFRSLAWLTSLEKMTSELT